MKAKTYKIKIHYDFPTEKTLEVEYLPDKWARVTCDTFRSFYGKRKIQGKTYEGPIYYMDTNKIYRPRKNDKICSIIGRNKINSLKRKKSGRT